MMAPKPKSLEQLRASLHTAPVVESEGPPDIPSAELWRDSERRNARHIARVAAKRKVAITIPDRRPIAIAAISDQHIQTDGPTDLRRMREDAELVRKTPGLYAMLGGDGVDNHIKHRSAMVASSSRPKHQWRLYDHYLSLFGLQKILGLISGNHDDWSNDFADVDVVRQLADRHRLFYAQDELLATITVGRFSFRYAMRHQYRYESSFNPTHAIRRWWEMGEADFDVGVLCHKHVLDCEPFVKHGRMRYALRPGSYQITSGYSRRYGYNHSTPSCPTVIIWPRKGTILGFWDVHQAADYLTYLRSRKTA
jgi:hypothetical protein